MLPGFEWDQQKAKANWRDHKVRFEEAATAFDDPDRLELFDRKHSTATEEREIIIGRSEKNRVLFVSFTSARTAHPAYQRQTRHPKGAKRL